MDIQYVSQSTGLYTNLSFGAMIGKGTFGSVFKLTTSDVSTSFVCKKIEIAPVFRRGFEMSQKEIVDATINEIHSLKTMNLLEGYARNKDCFFIIMKEVEGVSPSMNNAVSVQLSFEALRDCHRKNISHFDGHSGNFLTDSSTQKTTAIDFGQSRDASLINIIMDIYLYFSKNDLLNLIQGKFLFELFIRDYMTYVKENKLEALINLVWWTGLIYGAIYGIPALMLPHHFFYDYLKSKILFQTFLELRGLAFTKCNMVYHFFSQMINEAYLPTCFKKPLFSI